MKRAAITIAAATALVFVGCTASPDEVSRSEVSETAEATPVTNDVEQTEHSSSDEIPGTPATDVDTDGPRAAESLEHLLTTLNTVYNDNADLAEHYTGTCDAPFETLEEYRECSPGDPAAYLDSIESPRSGELIITLMPEAWGGGEYDPDQVYTVPYLAGNLHSYIGRHTTGMLKLTTRTPDGEYEATQGRLPASASSDAPKTEAELDSWADDRFEDWLRAMNSTYQGLCGDVDSVTDYRQCVPDDPHGYITSVEAPDDGELVVRIEDGAWQGGPYEPAPEFMAGNMMLKIGSYSNDVDVLTVITEDGQSHSVQYEPEGDYSDIVDEPSS